MRLVLARIVSLLVFTLFLSGCIPDRAFQPVETRQPQFIAPKIDAPPAFGDNVATIELNGAGNLQNCCGTAQLDFAQKLVKAARIGVTDKSKVMVITFIHGNQNNA